MAQIKRHVQFCHHFQQPAASVGQALFRIGPAGVATQPVVRQTEQPYAGRMPVVQGLGLGERIGAFNADNQARHRRFTHHLGFLPVPQRQVFGQARRGRDHADDAGFVEGAVEFQLAAAGSVTVLRRMEIQIGCGLARAPGENSADDDRNPAALQVRQPDRRQAAVRHLNAVFLRPDVADGAGNVAVVVQGVPSQIEMCVNDQHVTPVDLICSPMIAAAQPYSLT